VDQALGGVELLVSSVLQSEHCQFRLWLQLQDPVILDPYLRIGIQLLAKIPVPALPVARDLDGQDYVGCVIFVGFGIESIASYHQDVRNLQPVASTASNDVDLVDDSPVRACGLNRGLEQVGHTARRHLVRG
jgi:hypothetical protein